VTAATSRLLSKADAAVYLGVSVRTLDDWVLHHQIAFVKTSEGRAGRVLFDRVDLDRWIDAHKTPAGRSPVDIALEEAMS
jgi:excisionase family DNA binding protein